MCRCWWMIDGWAVGILGWNNQRLTTNQPFGYRRSSAWFWDPVRDEESDAKNICITDKFIESHVRYTSKGYSHEILVVSKEIVWDSWSLKFSILSLPNVSSASSHRLFHLELLKPLIPTVQLLDYSNFTHNINAKKEQKRVMLACNKW